MQGADAFCNNNFSIPKARRASQIIKVISQPTFEAWSERIGCVGASLTVRIARVTMSGTLGQRQGKTNASSSTLHRSVGGTFFFQRQHLLGKLPASSVPLTIPPQQTETKLTNLVTPLR